jgi:hypothetical protein
METRILFKVYVVEWSDFLEGYKTYYNYNVFNTFEEASDFMKKKVKGDFKDETQEFSECIENYQISDNYAVIDKGGEKLEYRVIEKEIAIDKTIVCMLSQFFAGSYESNHKLMIMSDSPEMQLCTDKTSYEDSFLHKEVEAVCGYNVDDRMAVFPSGDYGIVKLIG